MLGADGERGRHRDVRDAEALQGPSDELSAGIGAGDALAHVEVQHRAARVFLLQLLLALQGLERVVGEADRELRGVGVVRGLGAAGLQDPREAFAVLFREPVGRAFGGCRLEVVEVARRLLELHHPRPDVVEEARRELLAPGGRDVLGTRGVVADHLVDAVHTDGREVVAQRAEVALGVGEEPRVHVTLDHLAFDLEAVAGELQELIHAREESGLVAGEEIPEARAVDRDDAHRPGLLGRPEEPVAALEQFAQIELQAAAHGPDHVRLQLGVQEVLEVGQAVLRRHGEEPVRVLAFPGEVRRDVVGRDREGEHAALCVACGHHLDVGPVDQVHLGLQFTVRERHLPPADDRHLRAQVLRADPVEGQIGEGGIPGHEGLAATAGHEGSVAGRRAPHLALVGATGDAVDVGLAIADDVQHEDAGILTPVDGAAPAREHAELLQGIEVLAVPRVEADAPARLGAAVALRVGLQEEPDLPGRQRAYHGGHDLARRMRRNRPVHGGLEEGDASAALAGVEVPLRHGPREQLDHPVVHLHRRRGLAGIGHDEGRSQFEHVLDRLEHPTALRVEELAHDPVSRRDPLLLGPILENVHLAVEVVGGDRERRQVLERVPLAVERQDAVAGLDLVIAPPALVGQALGLGVDALGAPARGHVQVVDELLDVLLHLGVAEAVLAHERRHVGVERAEGLRPRPLVLQRAEEVDDLADRARHVLRRARFHLAGDAVQALGEQRAQRPAGAVPREHVQVVDVHVALPVGVADLGRVDVGEPVVGDDLAGSV